MTDADEPPGAGHLRKAPGGWFPAAVAVALVAQLLVLGFSFGAGLGAPDVLTWMLALAQAAGGFVVVYALAARRRRTVLLVPVASLALTAVIFQLGTLLAQAQACSAQERSLAAELASPPGVTIDLRGGTENRCAAQFTTDLSAEALFRLFGDPVGITG